MQGRETSFLRGDSGFSILFRTPGGGLKRQGGFPNRASALARLKQVLQRAAEQDGHTEQTVKHSFAEE
jgi:hypothetical protein